MHNILILVYKSGRSKYFAKYNSMILGLQGHTFHFRTKRMTLVDKIVKRYLTYQNFSSKLFMDYANKIV